MVISVSPYQCCLYSRSLYTVGTNRTATADPQWFDGGEVQGFIIPNGNFQMCFFNPAINKDCQGISDFFKHCGENCTQHSMEETVIKLSNTTWLVNIRMLEPSTTKDEAYVIRVYNNTLVYMAEGPCSATEHLYEDWSPKLLLQRPSLSTNTPPTTDESKGKYYSCMHIYMLCMNKPPPGLTKRCRALPDIKTRSRITKYNYTYACIMICPSMYSYIKACIKNISYCICTYMLHVHTLKWTCL